MSGSLSINVLGQAALNVFIFLLLSNIAFVTYACARKCASGEMKAEDVPFFTVTVGFHITFNFKNLIDMMPRLLKMLLPLYRVLDHLSSKSAIEPNPNSLPDTPPILPPGGRFRGEITFVNVKFAYPIDLRKLVLTGLTISIEPGQKVGLCGEAGCGKSTTFLLLQRLFDADPSGGALLIDGVDIRRYDVHALRRRICMVAQQTVLFKTSVRENIVYGCEPRPSDADIRAALEQAQAWSFIHAISLHLPPSPSISPLIFLHLPMCMPA